MSFASTSVAGTRAARYSLLTVELPGQEAMTAGVLLEDPVANLVYIRLRRDWEHFAPEEAEVLSLLEDDLLARAAQMGAAQFLAQLEDTLSNTVRVSERAREVFDEGLAAVACTVSTSTPPPSPSLPTCRAIR